MKRRNTQKNICGDPMLEKSRLEASNLWSSSPRKKRKSEISNPFVPPDLNDMYSYVKTPLLNASYTNSHRELRERLAKRYKMEIKKEEIKDSAYEGRRYQQHVSDMIAEQREVFLSNLLIDRHVKELERINYMRNTKKNKLEEMEFVLEEDQNRSRTVSRQLEMTRNRERFHLDEQIQSRKLIESKLNKKKVTVGELKNEQLILEQRRDNYKLCKDLLDEMESYYGKKLENEKEFLDVFDIMERDNLFLIKNKKQIEMKSEGKYQDLNDEIDVLKKDIEELKIELSGLRERKASIKKLIETAQNTADLDAKLMKLQKLISGTYQRCFGTTDATQNSLAMLSLIESNIERMLKKLAAITDKEALAKEVKKYNNKRRKEFREANNEKKFREQEAKKKAMIARATKPVKPRTGRPVIERILTGRAKKVNTAKLEAERDERERLDQLLFGNSIFE